MFHNPIFWAQFGLLSWRLANLIKPLLPTVVVLSLPRSGSSWVGEVLGSAPKALYLREPLTQSAVDFGAHNFQLTDETFSEPPPNYETFLKAAFQGLPIFHPRVVTKPEQWSLYRRWGRRVVIKEVNLRMCPLVIRKFQPRIILLVRHPAAVLQSWRRLKWAGSTQTEAEALAHDQARLLRQTLDTLADYPQHCVVRYEDLCLDPVTQFRRLYDFAGFTWHEQVEALIQEHLQGGDRADTYGTFRKTAEMVDAWRGGLSQEELQSLRDVYHQYDLPWFSQASDW